jgi:Domain of unknown function (DUF222)
MSLLTELRSTVNAQRRILRELEPGCLSGKDALALLAVLSDGERVLAAGRTRLAKRVEDSNVWRGSGERSAAQFLAKETGTSVGRTQAMLETATQLRSLPATAEAFADGRLSEAQAEAVAGAAVRNPEAERRLLEHAGRDTLKGLRDECRRVKTAGRDQQAIYDAIHRARSLRTWTDAEGAFCGAFRTTPDAGARMLGALDAEIERVFKAARSEKRREPRQAYAADALEALVCGGGGGKRARESVEIGVYVDHAAILRGHTEGSEVCEIAGIGPVPVALVKEWEADAYLRLILTHGIDVRAITRRSRHIDTHQDAALRARDRSCIIAGCDVTWGLERDHHVPFAQGGPTCLDNLGRMCGHHHALKSRGWQLVGGPGSYRLVPPDAEASDETGDENGDRNGDRAPP